MFSFLAKRMMPWRSSSQAVDHMNACDPTWTCVELVPVNNPACFLPSSYIKLEVLHWLERTVAPMTVNKRAGKTAWAIGRWTYQCPDAAAMSMNDYKRHLQVHKVEPQAKYRHQFWFADPRMAVMFKLRFGGK